MDAVCPDRNCYTGKDAEFFGRETWLYPKCKGKQREYFLTQIFLIWRVLLLLVFSVCVNPYVSVTSIQYVHGNTFVLQVVMYRGK